MFLNVRVRIPQLQDFSKGEAAPIAGSWRKVRLYLLMFLNVRVRIPQLEDFSKGEAAPIAESWRKARLYLFMFLNVRVRLPQLRTFVRKRFTEWISEKMISVTPRRSTCNIVFYV
jgi:hypothetical protein